MERGILLLVEDANDAQLGPLVRALCVEHPDLQVITEAARIDDAPHGSVIVLATRAEDALWLNLARPIFAERALRVVLWSRAETTAELARRAPDFFDWIARRLPCPPGPPAFAVAGLRGALRARAWAVAYRGRGMEESFSAAFPRRKRGLIRLDASLDDATLAASVEDAGAAWIVWANVLDERGMRRVRKIATGAGRRGRNLLDNPRGENLEAWPVSDMTADLREASRALERAGAAAPGRLAALLDLEPDAITLAVELLHRGAPAGQIERVVLGADDPGAAVARLAGEGAPLDPVLVAGYRVPAPVQRAFAADPRVRKASAVLAGGTGPPLPPLLERLPPGAAGKAAFDRLTAQLLSIHIGGGRLRTSENDKGGIEAMAPGGVPGMTGAVIFQIEWSGDPDLSNIPTSGLDVAKDKNVKQWILVTPREPTPSGRAWLRWEGERRGLQVEHWGPERIELLLRRYPPLLARYYPEEARAYLPGYDGTSFAVLAARYRAGVARLHNRLKTIGIPPEVRPRESRIELPLAELFIPLRLSPEKRDARPVGLARALERSGSAVVLADPGMGKSTLLAYLALVYAGGAGISGVTSPPGLLPLHISLRDFVRRQKERPGLSFVDHLHIEARERLDQPSAHPAFFEAALRMGEAVVLLDGLDEVGNESARHAVSTSIQSFQADYPDCRFWVTSRIYGYTENVRLPSSFVHYRIEPLDDEQIDDFVDRWYAHQITASPREGAEQATSLRAAVRRTPSVRRLAGNPLLLTLMAFIHHGLRRLPRDRGELYEKCVEMLLKTWQDARRGDGEAPRTIEGLTLDVSTQKDYLAHLAFFAQRKNQGGGDEEARGLLSRHDAVDALAARHLARAQRERPTISEVVAREEMARFLDYVCDETGLLLDRGNDQITFIHLSFQEYLAAWVFLCDDQLPHGPGFFVEHLGDPAWEEVLLLRLYIVIREGGGVARFDEILDFVLRALEQKHAPEGWLTLARALRDDLELSDRDRREILRQALAFWLEAPAFAGTWYTVLEEVKLFGERARVGLRDVIAEARAHVRGPANAIALLHLETKLFAFPLDAGETLRRRADLGELLSDLVSFVDEPAIRPLLAEKARVADWARALRALDGPLTYQKTVRWMTGAPAPRAAEAATATLWSKVLSDLRSRAAFATPRQELVDAALFEEHGVLTYKGEHSSATLPYACLRVSPASIPAEVVVSEASLLWTSPAQTRQEGAATLGLWTELTAWTTSLFTSQLDGFAPSALPRRDAIPGLAALFVHGLTHDFLQDFISDFGRDFGNDFVRGFGSSFGRSFIRSFGRSFIRSFGASFFAGFGRFCNEFGSALGDPLRSSGPRPNRRPEKGRKGVTANDDPEARRSYEDFFLREYTERSISEVGFHETVAALRTALVSPLALPLLLADIWSAATNQMFFASFRHAAVEYARAIVPQDALETWLLHNPIEVYATALAWEEHRKALGDASGPTAALVIAHAAYATLMTGLECELPFVPDLADPRVRVSFHLYELCNFRDAEVHARALEQEIASPAPEVRPLLEAAGLRLPASYETRLEGA